MQASVEERSGLLVYLKCMSWFDRMQADPLNRELVTKSGYRRHHR